MPEKKYNELKADVLKAVAGAGPDYDEDIEKLKKRLVDITQTMKSTGNYNLVKEQCAIVEQINKLIDDRNKLINDREKEKLQSQGWVIP